MDKEVPLRGFNERKLGLGMEFWVFQAKVKERGLNEPFLTDLYIYT